MQELTTVEIGQYFKTEDTAGFSHLTDSASREYILPRDEDLSEPKVGFEGTPKLGPCYESHPAVCKVDMEWKSELSL